MTKTLPKHFITAVFNSNAQDVKDALAKNVIDLDCDFFSHTPLIYATFKNNKDIVKTLLDNGANPDFEDTAGSTALRWAARNGNAEMTALLLQYNADPNLQDKDDMMTALHYATYEGDAKTITALLDAGADIDLTNKEGETALDYAKRFGKKDAFDLLNQARIQQDFRKALEKDHAQADKIERQRALRTYYKHGKK